MTDNKYTLDIDEGAIYLGDQRICVHDDERDNDHWRFMISAMDTLVKAANSQAEAQFVPKSPREFALQIAAGMQLGGAPLTNHQVIVLAAYLEVRFDRSSNDDLQSNDNQGEPP